jgi:sigma-B regulation protein RsbU (phosphoserine phosphatase)
MPNPPDNLTQFIPPATLQRLLDSFAAVTGFEAQLRDPQGALLLESGPPVAETALSATLAKHGVRRPPIAQIEASGQRLATISLRPPAEPLSSGAPGSSDLAVAEIKPAKQADAVRLLYLLADTLSQMSRQGMQLQNRLEELTMLAELSTLLAGRRDLSGVLETVVKSVADLMGAKAGAIRLLDDNKKELRIVAVHNLSSEYLAKGPLLMERSVLDQQALAGEVVYVPDMTSDDRVLYPDDAKREGLCSMLGVGMVYRGQPIGVARIYTAHVQDFSQEQKHFLQAVANLAAAAIRNAQLDTERMQHLRVQRQVELAADVQRRLLPQSAPVCPPYEVAGRYAPCFELGGDFFDFIPLESSLGVVVGDVVGKGVAAGLLMASVRASLRAHVEDVYDLDEVMVRVNHALCRDTRDHEFATVWYGTLDCNTMRMTYCSAGHEPTLLLRGGKVEELSIGGLPLGVAEDAEYEKGLVDLRPGDVLLLSSDGVSDASDFNGVKFGRQRVRDAVLEVADQSARLIVNHVLWQVRRFVGLNYRPDDMTLVAVKVHERAAK